jgi:hypothetical protein
MKRRAVLIAVLAVAGCAHTAKQPPWTIIEDDNGARWVVLHTATSNQKTKYVIVCNPKNTGCYPPPGRIGHPLCGRCEVRVDGDLLELKYGNRVSESYVIVKTCAK